MYGLRFRETFPGALFVDFYGSYREAIVHTYELSFYADFERRVS